MKSIKEFVYQMLGLRTTYKRIAITKKLMMKGRTTDKKPT